MKSTSSTITAYVAWALTLCAILMPPAFAAAGVGFLIDARDAVYSLVEDDTALSVADLRSYDPHALG
jgi:hypothetical protein